MITVFDVIYRCKDSMMIRIYNDKCVIYSGDVYTYRVSRVPYRALSSEVITIDILPDLHAPILLIKV